MLRVVALLVALGSVADAQEEPAAPAAALRKLRSLTGDVARAGDEGLVSAMRSALLALGDDAGAIERAEPGWRKALAGKPSGAAEREKLARKLRQEVQGLGAGLAALDEPRRIEIARALLALDSQDPAANAAAGNAEGERGTWRTSERARWELGAKRTTELLNEARRLPIELAHRTSANTALVELYGGGNEVGVRGVDLHSTIEPSRLERILTQALRASAFSHGLLLGEVKLPPHLLMRDWVLLASDADFRRALDEALAAHGIGPDMHRQALELDLGSFVDERGWRTVRFRPEADCSALVLRDMVDDWIGPEVQPCLRVGHTNWIALTFLGTSIPGMAWVETPTTPLPTRTVAKRDDAFYRGALLRCARRSLHGCRAWMVREVLAGRAPPWSRAMLEHDGEIVDELLLESTLVSEMLQEEERLWPLMDDTRKLPAASLKTMLGEPLADLEARWKRWLLPEEVGVVQRLAASPASEAADPRALAALAALERARSSAFEGQSLEIPSVELEPELSRAAGLHAAYLARNPGQKQRWPDVHEEYADREGFDPVGAVAGLRSVIAFDDTPEAAVESWLGTFYHRLSLLDPGLVGVGYGEHEGVQVLDAGSLVLAPWQDHVVLWPVPDAKNVPRGFVPEMPNPLPGVDLADVGHPVTVQLFLREQREPVALTMELFEGDPGPKNAVPSWLLTPQAPRFPDLAPENAWCLVAEKKLKAGTRYTVRASWLSETRTWRFTTGS